MISTEQNMQCPNCGELISIDDVLSRQIENKIRKDFENKQQLVNQEIARKSEEILKKESEIIEQNKNLQAIISQQVSEKLNIERIKIMKAATEAAESEHSAKATFLEIQLKEKEEKLQNAKENELKLLKEKLNLEEEKKFFELEKIRQLEEERAKIQEAAARNAAEKEQFKIAQLNKQLADIAKANDELKRKLEQGSQKIQGEVLELKLEDLLKTEFPQDEIIPVPIGVNGADIIQKVIDRSGRTCGQIVWETKRTKSWQGSWVQKLKDDQRAIKADIAVIVSAALPEDVSGFVYRDGVWICEIQMIIPLATALRLTLNAIARERCLSIDKTEKMEVLYNYLSGIEFNQRVEAIMEAFISMESGLKKEKMAYEKIWAERAKQLQKVLINTAGMYGDLSGLISLPQINMLELNDEKLIYSK